MAKFEIAIEKTLFLEGGGKVVNDRFDPGGLTRWGISKASYQEIDISSLTKEQAVSLYKHDFWHPLYEQIESQEVANELFDFGVNTSARGWPKTAVRIFQEALQYFHPHLQADGYFGPATLILTNATVASSLLGEFRACQAYYYAQIVIRQADAKEEEKKRFLKGWLRRVMA